MSLLGSHLDAIHVGSPPDVRYSAEVAEWHVDRLVTTAVVKLLRERGFPARPMSMPDPPERFYHASDLSDGAGDLDVERLVAVAKKAHIGTLVVVHRIPRDPADPHEQFFDGAYGLYYRSLFGIGRSAVYTLAGVQVIDVPQSQVLVRRRLPAWDGWDNQLPQWTTTFAELSPQARASVRQRLESRLLERVQAASLDLKL